MTKYHIVLTDIEQSLVSKIDLRDNFAPGEDAHKIFLANQEPILDLLETLAKRNAIPQNRIDYVADPELKPGRTKGSRIEMFERHGNEGSEVFTHPNFKKHIRYFLYGAELPSSAIEEFEEAVGKPEWFSGSDILDLTPKVRAIVRKYGLKGHEDEFMKLALDYGLSTRYALDVRRAAKEASRR